jgi:hypothetical protein
MNRMSKLCGALPVLSQRLRKPSLRRRSAWKMATGIARSVTGDPSGFLEMINYKKKGKTIF